MNSLRASFLAAVLPLLFFLPGCESLPGKGGSNERGLVSLKIDFVDRYDLDQAIPIVFRSEGFQLTGRYANSFTFHRSGDAATQATYGEWFAPGNQVRVDVILTAPEFGEYLVRCDVYAIPPGSAQWIAVHEGKSQFRKILKKVKQLAEVM